MTIFDHLGPERAKGTRETNEADIERIRATEGGEREQLINRMIEDNIGLATVVVNSFIDRATQNFDYLRDDLYSVAFVALTEAVHALADLPTPESDSNVNGYISVSILRSVSRHAESDWQDSQHGQFEFQRCGDFGDGDDPGDIGDIAETASDDALEPDELDSFDEMERSIIQLRTEGYTFEAIANRLGVTLAKVTYVRDKMRERYGKRSA